MLKFSHDVLSKIFLQIQFSSLTMLLSWKTGHSSLLSVFGLSATSTYDSYLPLKSSQKNPPKNPPKKDPPKKILPKNPPKKFSQNNPPKKFIP